MTIESDRNQNHPHPYLRLELGTAFTQPPAVKVEPKQPVEVKLSSWKRPNEPVPPGSKAANGFTWD